MRASYSASLFDFLKLKWKDFSMTISFGPSSTMSTPVPFGFEESFTCKIYHYSSAIYFLCRSIAKSTKH